MSAIPVKLSRGLRNSNPLNLRHSPDKWLGKSPSQTDSEFVQFVDAHHGIRAGAKNLLTYYRKYKLSTVPAIIEKWAPPEDDNDTAAYISSVTTALGVSADTKLDLEDPEILAALVAAMIKVECGTVPYTTETIRSAVYAAYSGGLGAPSPPPAATPQPPNIYVPPAPPANAEKPVPPLVDQPTSTPTRKVQAIPYGGLILGVPSALVIKWLWDTTMPDKPMDENVAIAMAGILSTAFSYLAAYYTRNHATAPAPAPSVPQQYPAQPSPPDYYQ